MIPPMNMVLGTASGALLAEVVPLVPPGYGQGTLGAVAMLGLFAAQEADRAADVRHTDILAMQAIFGEATPVLGADHGLSARLQEAIALKLASLSVAYLDQHHGMLTNMLIDLHVAAEAMANEAGRALERRILTYLVEAAERRILVVPQG